VQLNSRDSLGNPLEREIFMSKEIAELNGIVREIDKLLAKLRQERKNVPREEKTTIDLRIKLLERCKKDSKDFWMF
jgi:CHAD domain-containing protein